MSGVPPRRAALRILTEVRAGRPFDAALDGAVAGLSEADRRLAHELAAGVLRQQTALDEHLAPLVPRGWNRVAPRLQDVLRLGAYQLTGLDRVPPHAAVNTSVMLGRENGGTRAGGFVNAVLRKVSRDAPPPSDDPAIAYSHPEWLVARWRERYGAEATERLLAWNNRRPGIVAQPARWNADRLADEWTAAGIEFHPAPWGAGLELVQHTRPAELPGYAEGGFVVQDPAQALVAWFADLPPGATLYDACAAPGGKSVALGRAAAQVCSADRNRARVARLAENLSRAGSGREYPVVADAARPPVRPVDAVLLDAPCLGTGTFARHPDARLRVTEEALAQLARQQGELLGSVAPVVRPGGLLVYATCSLEPEENEIQVERFLKRHPEFTREPPADFPPALLSPMGDLMILPHRDQMDGAFAARLRRAS